MVITYEDLCDGPPLHGNLASGNMRVPPISSMLKKMVFKSHLLVRDRPTRLLLMVDGLFIAVTMVDVDLHARDWKMNRFVNLDCSVQYWHYTAEFVDDYLVILASSSVLIFSLDSLDIHAVDLDKESPFVDPSATLEFAVDRVNYRHRCWSGVIRAMHIQSLHITLKQLQLIPTFLTHVWKLPH
ncbi:hypothetical protein CALVIDRAFT_535457 [Calocera viscosa TUFC12733]|uniref:Uncharacterized protein n=1 Tax=Calocera viscosa (strain TUFC12733) TaxID=1330018 RepID=A0A167P383_CALVF|nr:hypothetical protein CALVIDRAFT_535457 [Calocera viscosa TUFC12733]